MDVVNTRKDNDAESAQEIQTKIQAVAEAYPELKSNENYKTLMTDLTTTENQIATYRENYNACVKEYRRYVRKSPHRYILDFLGYEVVDYEMLDFDVSEDAPTNIKKVKERYTKHTRKVTKTDSKGKEYTEIETYWTWDKVGSEEKHCENISFAGVQFKYGEIEIPDSEYITTIKESSKIRYKYYGCNAKYTGTLFANLKDDTISEAQFFNGVTIQETIDSLESGAEIVLFWVFWILLIIGVVIGFCYLENRWLE